MAEYIDRIGFHRWIRETKDSIQQSYYSVDEITDWVLKFPAANVRETGKWIVGKSKWNENFNSYTCPFCGCAFQFVAPLNYCAECGAYMRGGNDGT